MPITLIRSAYGNDVHGADNDRKTGCGIRYNAAENYKKYIKAGEMVDLEDITCPKCKEVLAKKIIRESNKQTSKQQKEERKKFAQAKKNGLVAESTFEEYVLNREAEESSRKAMRQQNSGSSLPPLKADQPLPPLKADQPLTPAERRGTTTYPQANLNNSVVRQSNNQGQQVSANNNTEKPKPNSFKSLAETDSILSQFMLKDISVPSVNEVFEQDAPKVSTSQTIQQPVINQSLITPNIVETSNEQKNTQDSVLTVNNQPKVLDLEDLIVPNLNNFKTEISAKIPVEEKPIQPQQQQVIQNLNKFDDDLSQFIVKPPTYNSTEMNDISLDSIPISTQVELDQQSQNYTLSKNENETPDFSIFNEMNSKPIIEDISAQQVINKDLEQNFVEKIEDNTPKVTYTSSYGMQNETSNNYYNSSSQSQSEFRNNQFEELTINNVEENIYVQPKQVEKTEVNYSNSYGMMDSYENKPEINSVQNSVPQEPLYQSVQQENTYPNIPIANGMQNLNAFEPEIQKPIVQDINDIDSIFQKYGSEEVKDQSNLTYSNNSVNNNINTNNSNINTINNSSIFTSQNKAAPMVDSIEEALSQLGAIDQKKIEKEKNEIVPDYIPYVPPSQKEKERLENLLNQPKSSNQPEKVISAREARRLAKIDAKFQKELAERGFDYIDVKTNDKRKFK